MLLEILLVVVELDVDVEDALEVNDLHPIAWFLRFANLKNLNKLEIAPSASTLNGVEVTWCLR